MTLPDDTARRRYRSCEEYESRHPDCPGCCDSCHDDFDQGFDSPWDYEDGDVTWFLCCAKARHFRERAVTP